MPIFEFVCEKCSTEFEELVRGFDAKGTYCPICKSEDVKKKVSLFASKAPGGKSTSYWGSSASKASSCKPGGL